MKIRRAGHTVDAAYVTIDDACWGVQSGDQEIVLEPTADELRAVARQLIAQGEHDGELHRPKNDSAFVGDGDALAAYLSSPAWSLETIVALLQAGGGVRPAEARLLVQDFRGVQAGQGSILVRLGATERGNGKQTALAAAGFSQIALLRDNGISSQYVAQQDDVPVLITLAAQQREHIAVMRQRMPPDSPGLLPLRYLGGIGGSSALVEELPRDAGSSGPLDPDAFIDLVSAMLRTLAALHAQERLVGTLQPELVFVSGSPARLAGFTPRPLQLLAGARQAERGVPPLFGETYMAPELLAGEPPTTASDVFSLAAVAVKLGTGRYPFFGEGSQQLQALFNAARSDARLPAALDAVIAPALSLEARRRPSASQLIDALRAR